MVLEQLSEIGTLPGKPPCRMFWLLTAMYEPSAKSGGFRQLFYYIHVFVCFVLFCLFEQGTQEESNWAILLFHMASDRVSWWWLAGCWSGLEGQRWIHLHACCIDRDSWKWVVTLLCLHHHLRASPYVLSFSVVTLLILWHRAPRNQDESCRLDLEQV